MEIKTALKDESDGTEAVEEDVLSEDSCMDEEITVLAGGDETAMAEAEAEGSAEEYSEEIKSADDDGIVYTEV